MKKNIKKSLICIYLILLCCVFLSTALSKNASKVSGEVSTSVAGMRLNVIKNTNNITNLSNAEKNIEFTVNNYDGTLDNPIYNDIQYNYEISISTTIPIEYRLYKVENGEENLVTVTNGISEKFTMPHSQIKEDSYILKIKLDDINYKNMEDVLNIDVYAVQL